MNKALSSVSENIDMDSKNPTVLIQKIKLHTLKINSIKKGKLLGIPVYFKFYSVYIRNMFSRFFTLQNWWWNYCSNLFYFLCVGAQWKIYKAVHNRISLLRLSPGSYWIKVEVNLLLKFPFEFFWIRKPIFFWPCKRSKECTYHCNRN